MERYSVLLHSCLTRISSFQAALLRNLCHFKISRRFVNPPRLML